MIVQYFILNVLLATIATAAVVDTEPPVFTDCPKDIMIDDNTITDNIRINWKRPTATDNSGVPPSVTSNRQSGALFPVPSSFEVLYKAIDAAGNEATCTFRITLKRKCLLYTAPKNGVLACLNKNGDNAVCAVMCKSSLDFVFNPALLYWCDGGQWNAYVIPGQPSSTSLPWPDCSSKVNPPSWFKTSGYPVGNYFFDGDANADPNVRDAIKTQFIGLMKSPLVPPPFCLFNPQCTEENIKLCVGASDIPVLDTEPPVFTDCPKDIMIDDNTVTDYIRINWNRPTATDNSGVPPSVTSNRQSGALFRVPGSHVVSYKAIDAAGNEATCTFRITLKRKTCPLYAPPKNGALACLDNNGENSYCVPMCPSSLDFVFDPAYLYYCIGAQWNFYIFPGQVPSSSLPWPDCSNQASPSQIKTSGFKSMYFDGDARDPSVQDAIKTKFVEFLKAPYFPPPFCLFRPECTEANVKVYAGALA